MPTDLPPPRGAEPPALPASRFNPGPLSTLVARTRRWLRVAGVGRLLLWLAAAVCAAMAIDLLLVALLSALANAWLLGAGALAGVAWTRFQRGQSSRGVVALAGTAAALLLAIGLWQMLEPRDPKAPRPQSDLRQRLLT